MNRQYFECKKRFLAVTLTALMCASPAFAEDQQCPATPDELLASLKSTDQSARVYAAQCFVERSVDFQLAELREPIALLLEDADPNARRAGLELIGVSLWAGTASDAQVSDQYAPQLRKVLQVDISARNRSVAATLIVHLDALHEAQLRGPLMRLLTDSDPGVWAAALGNLIKLGIGLEPAVTNVLLSKANSADEQQRRFGYRGLGRTHANQVPVSNNVMQVLLRGLREETIESRIQAANALGSLYRGGATAEADLQAIAWNPKQPAQLRKAAQDAVELITGKPIRAPWVSNARALPTENEGASGAAPLEEKSR